jgi:DEAD/DEAH box helicase domain-containing protein
MPTLISTLHAAEHSLIALLPLWAMCDRWDIGGLSTNIHPDTGAPTIFVYDGHPGGVGITERGFVQFEGWVADTVRLLDGCPCERGCPSCVQSPKCGNLNEYLDKVGALTLLRRMSAS